MNEATTKAGLLFLGRKRPGFDEEWGSAMADRVRKAVAGRPWAVFECPTKAVDDASLRRAVAESTNNGCDTLIALQTTMSDGRLAPILAQLWKGPVVLWATPEKPEGDLVSSCSLVGTHLFASLFARLGVPFEVISGAPEDSRVSAELDAAVAATSCVSRLGAAKIGLIGYHAPGFINMHSNPYELDRHLGAELFQMGQQDLLRTMDDLPADAVSADIRTTMGLGMPLVDLEESDLEIQSRYYLALKAMADEESLDAIALRCWPELPNLTGQWPYLAMVRLADEGYAVTMEGDVDGAIGMLILRQLGLETGYLTDWLEHDDECITTWHGGGTPECLAAAPGEPNGRTIARHFNSSKPAVVDGWIAPDQPVTIMRTWSDSDGYTMMVREAVSVEPTRHLRGTNGRIRLADENPHELFDLACHAGMPHHLTVFPGHHEQLVLRAARLLDMDRL
jgi:L-fucose isomerase-like protein